jgi:hypothetical protein
MSGNPNLTLFHGSRDMLELIDEVHAKIVAGEIEGIVICDVSDIDGCGGRWAYRDDMVHPYARLSAAVMTAAWVMQRDGL